MANLELINGCKNPKTLELYTRCSINPHVHTLSMGVDNEGLLLALGIDGVSGQGEHAEMVILGFDMHGDSLLAYGDVISEQVSIFLGPGDGMDHYGDSTFNDLLTFLENTSHISSIFNKPKASH